jgi:hypothetical protein
MILRNSVEECIPAMSHRAIFISHAFQAGRNLVKPGQDRAEVAGTSASLQSQRIQGGGQQLGRCGPACRHLLLKFANDCDAHAFDERLDLLNHAVRILIEVVGQHLVAGGQGGSVSPSSLSALVVRGNVI